MNGTILPNNIVGFVTLDTTLNSSCIFVVLSITDSIHFDKISFEKSKSTKLVQYRLHKVCGINGITA